MDMREKRKYPVPAANVLANTTKKLKLTQNLILYRTFNKWAEIAGKQVAEHARPERWQRGTLIIRVESSSWMQELSFLKKEIVARLQKYLPDITVKTVRFEVGELPPQYLDAVEESKAYETKILSADENEFIEQAVSQISDEDTREAAKKAMHRAFSIKHPETSKS